MRSDGQPQLFAGTWQSTFEGLCHDHEFPLTAADRTAEEQGGQEFRAIVHSKNFRILPSSATGSVTFYLLLLSEDEGEIFQPSKEIAEARYFLRSELGPFVALDPEGDRQGVPINSYRVPEAHLEMLRYIGNNYMQPK